MLQAGRDCVADARVYFSAEDQAILDSAISVKPLSADIVFTFIDVEPMQFNRGFYTVDVRFFIRSSYDAYTGVNRPQRIEGLTVFDKKAILFGSEGNAKTYSSLYLENSYDIPLPVGSNMPIAAVEVLGSDFCSRLSSQTAQITVAAVAATSILFRAIL